ncbi:hypothetical protein RND71_007216 [Anisodus tanguticus]|uniref:Uncharacterized protein n=1 Tax=Anisodus tanguticus TaxID=243964 RepID=A0AAE1SL64_9SOLA|nr:hypothetical protein RND71_007216 [Anisodus tanguticus]
MAVNVEFQRRQAAAAAATAAAPRWIPERGQVVKNAIRKIFSCFSKRRRSRYSSTVFASSHHQ